MKRFGRRLPKIYDKQVASALETYSAGEEKAKVRIGSEGSLSLVHDGDGDPTLETRIYVDGELKESAKCDELAIFHLAFFRSLEVKGYSGTEQEGRNSSFYITGVVR